MLDKMIFLLKLVKLNIFEEIWKIYYFFMEITITIVKNKFYKYLVNKKSINFLIYIGLDVKKTLATQEHYWR